MNGPLYTPAGKLKNMSYYNQGADNFWHRIDYYYDAEGKELMTVKVKGLDTIQIRIHQYLPNGQIEKTLIPKSRDNLLLELQRSYLDAGKTIEVNPSNFSTNSYFEKLKFDESGRIIYYQRGKDPNSEFNEYFYENETSQNISMEYYREFGMPDPLDIYYYSYGENGNLLSKRILLATGEYYPVYEFAYNSQNQLIEEWQNDIYFWSGPIERKTYEYY